MQRQAVIGPSGEPYNISQHVTASRIQGLLRAAEAGETRELFALYRDLTSGGSHIQCELNKRKLALLAQPRSELPARKADKDDMQAAAACTQMVSDCENWMDGMSHLQDSCLLPVTVCEKIWRPVQPGEPAAELGMRFTLRRLEPVNPTLLCFKRANPHGASENGSGANGILGQDNEWEPYLKFFTVDAATGQVDYNVQAAYRADPERHVVHRGHLLTGLPDCHGGPMRAVVFWWLLATVARDWFARGMERYAMPFPVGHTDAKNPAAIKLLEDAFAESVKIGGLVVDHETQIELKEIAAQGMADAYERFLNVCNREISKCIVGQTLSAEAQSTGLGSSVGKLHSDVREDIRMFDQLKLAETVRKQIFEQGLRINGFRGQAPKVVWGGLSDADAKLLAEVLDILARAGFEPTDEAIPTLSERVGFEIQRSAKAARAINGTDVTDAPGSLPLADGAKAAKDKKDLEGLISPRVRSRLAALSAQSGMADSLGVPASWLNPVRDFLEELQRKAADATLSEEDLLDFMDAAAKRVPELFRDMDVDALAKVLEAGMGDAVVSEVRRKTRHGPAKAAGATAATSAAN